MSSQQSENSEQILNSKLSRFCSDRVGAFDPTFLCRSVGSINISEPLCVSETATVRDAVKLLKEHKSGCIMVLNDSHELVGIFSERDCMLKVMDSTKYSLETPVNEVMTRDPVCEGPECTLAYALTLMSQGGFRHLPVIDDQRIPVGLLSVKNVVDQLVGEFLEALDSKN